MADAMTPAVQLLINLNGVSLTISNNKKNAVSLKISRTIGDGANKFTLQLFDETAWKLESLLYGSGQAPISFRYGASGEWRQGRYVTFSGICVNYSLSFVGAATMLTIEGIVQAFNSIEGTSTVSYWFKPASICWVDTNLGGEYDASIDYSIEENRAKVAVDGKWATAEISKLYGKDQGYNDEGTASGGYSTETCARIEWLAHVDSNGKTIIQPRVLVNPSNIFRRIINKYNGKIGPYWQTMTGIDMDTGNPIDIKSTAADTVSWSNEQGNFEIGDVDESLWIDASSLNLTQTNETAASFIANTLCRIAIKPGSKSAGFKYFIKNGKHCFKAIDYSSTASNKIVKAGYYLKDSEVISFTVDSVGAMIMAGAERDEQGNYLGAISTADLLTGDVITSDLVNYEGHFKTEDDLTDEEKATTTNWYYTRVTSVKVMSSATKTLADVTLKSQLDKVKDFAVTATLTIWGDYSDVYIPGNYIEIIVMTPEGKQHYSSGKYFIVSADDSINSDGYTITLKLLKNTDIKKDQFDASTEEIARREDGLDLIYINGNIQSPSNIAGGSFFNGGGGGRRPVVADGGR